MQEENSQITLPISQFQFQRQALSVTRVSWRCSLSTDKRADWNRRVCYLGVAADGG
jgi:hypothetical protein